MTTSQLREAARKTEKLLRWDEAADLWERAIAAYPPHSGSQLAERDIERMRLRAKSCRSLAKSEREIDGLGDVFTMAEFEQSLKQ